MQYKPYTYLLKWPDGTKYYGCRYARNKANPKELGISYFSSSALVKDKIRSNGHPIYEVRKIFSCGKNALRWENRFLTRIDAKNREDFLNRSNGAKDFGGRPFTQETRIKQSVAAKKRWASNPISNSTRSKMRAAAKERMKNSRTREKISDSLKNQVQSEDTKKKRSKTMSKLKWWNNGMRSVRAEHQPDGFIRGRMTWKD